ncbi:hypothetical protein C8A05DRAFT_35163 [Staphylotrichum tortipilum]|uniref:Uncharacterized protein n=1 Tax=Staphylotrichum tortipilum TaxID=2831512 RepID=A0AAN6RT47_9PEZI|nr:hypothetical protein C8A05DRAFT_35163 [Staphylotrichum longicolle]
MSRTVKFRRPSPGDYDHQRSDSGFSDCESRTSNPEREYPITGYDDPGLYSIRQALESSRQEADKWRAKFEDAEEKLKETRNDSEQEKAHTRALTNEISVLSEERDKLAKANKELVEQVAQLQDTIKELKKASRKSGTSSPSGSSATASESSDEKEKKVRRSSSKRPSKESSNKDKERGRERENKERDKEQREKERERERERERRKEKEETERLRKRFDARGDESDAKSSNTSTKSSARTGGRRDTASYIEPMGHGAPRPAAAPVPPSPSTRQYAAAYSTTPGYASIREPFSAAAPRSLHPTVYVADEYSYNAADDEDGATYHPHPPARSARHAR